MAKSDRNKTIDFTEEELKEYEKELVPQDQLSTLLTSPTFSNKTINGDTFEILDKLIASNQKYPLIIVDPPYNLEKVFNGNKFSKMTDEKYLEYTESWVSKLDSLLEPIGTIYVCCDWKCSSVIETVLKKYFKVRNRITWQREKGRGSKDNWKNSSEDIWYCTKSNDFYFNLEDVKVKKENVLPYKDKDGKAKDWNETATERYRMTAPSNFWYDITIPFWSMPENTTHPTQKPEKLIAKLILASSKPQDIILDPFVGSGTTSVVAKKLDRQYVGIEQSKLYCLYGEYRLKRVETDKEIQGYENGIFLATPPRPQVKAKNDGCSL